MDVTTEELIRLACMCIIGRAIFDIIGHLISDRLWTSSVERRVAKMSAFMIIVWAVWVCVK
jgi:hypothetical protein